MLHRLALLLLSLLVLGIGVPAAAEDPFCATHGVPEAVCTKCKPKLAAIFKAKGNWCAEHGLPESFCPICHPERGGRPQVGNLSKDPAPADGTKVRLATPEVARLAGIETVKAVERPASAAILAVVRLSYDASRVAAVNARSPGVVRELRAEVGSRVERGTPLALIESTSVGADRSRLTAAKSRLDIAADNLARERRLFEQDITSRRDFLAAEQEWTAARGEFEAIQSALLGVGDTLGGRASYSLTAPLTGTVTRREVSLGQLVDTEHTLFELVDTSVLWAELDIPEAVVARTAVGQSVVVTLSSLPGREFAGRLTFLAPAVDPETRTVRGRVPLANPEGVLRANMFGEARILLAPGRSAVAVPRSALQRVGGVPLIFVQLAADRYETRRVRLAGFATDSLWLELERGVRPGEPVVTTGSFQLKTETVKTSIGAGCCEVE